MSSRLRLAQVLDFGKIMGYYWFLPMKDKIHPTYNEKVAVTCSCGNTFETGSTEKEISVEVCAACHPFYTGKQKLVDVAGRVDTFKKKLAAVEVAKSEGGGRSKKKRTKSKKTDSDTVKLN